MTRTSRAAGVLLAIAFNVACVPASEPLPPAGAAGFLTKPSAASRGQPFVTDDGWTVRFEELVIFSHVSVQAADQGAGAFGEFLFNGRSEIGLYLPALKPGLWRVGLAPGSGVFEGRSERIVIDVSPKVVDRFRTAPDLILDEGRSAELFFRVVAEKEGRTVSMELALARSVGSGVLGFEDRRPLVRVEGDSFASAPLPILAENLFAEAAAPETTPLPGTPVVRSFQLFADADVAPTGDADGMVSPLELAQQSVSCAGCGGPISLLQLLSDRVEFVLNP